MMIVFGRANRSIGSEPNVQPQVSVDPDFNLNGTIPV
jgi:hypothetical protein